MRLIRYLFTTVLALLFISCSKGCSYNESQSSHVEQTTSSNQVEDKISPDDYELSTDGLTLIKWKNPNTKVLDMNRDTHLSKIRFIGDWAFWDCSSLTSINIPNSVTSIGEWAFMQCSSLTSINIPNSVTSIKHYAFSNCSSLTSIDIPNSVTNIEQGTFSDCNSLTNVTIPISVTSIDKFAFAHCINLGSVVFKGNNPPKIPSLDSYVFNETPSNLKLIIPKGAKNRYIKAGYPEDKIIEQ